MAPSTKQVLSLYKQLLGEARKFDNYNFREYFGRRVHDAFREHRNVSDAQQVTALYNEGVSNLATLHRQAAISQMFTFDKLVVEPLKKQQ